MTYAAVSVTEVGEMDDWMTEIQQDDKLRAIVQDLMVNSESHPSYILQDLELQVTPESVLAARNNSSREVEMPTTIEELEAAIQDTTSQANSILFVNHNILEQYEDRQRQKILQQNLKQTRRNLEGA
ncbi:putative structural maintenance of chromosomes protein 5 isoform [Sesbania bispinosa]|nr:putative structural maintenance of chromosomes protein 5 isoform [Sesbania bispinosa]